MSDEKRKGGLGPPFLYGMRPATLPNLTAVLGDFVDVLLPSCCSLCRQERAQVAGTFCPECLDAIRPVDSPRCPRCSLPYPGETDRDHLCEHCLREPPAYTRVLAAAHYEGVLREAVHRFKYRGAIGLDRPLTFLLFDRFEQCLADFSPDLVVPVPLHVDRLRRRTYNQALLLARRLGRMLELPVGARALSRSRATHAQQKLSGRGRRANLRGAFAGSGEVAGRRVLLVDDVMTTGATVEACSRELRRCGAGEVLVAVLARSAVGADSALETQEPRKVEILS